MASHPIQYQVPLYRRLAQSETIELTVAYLGDFGISPSFDPGFGRRIAYDVPLLEGYSYRMLSTHQDRSPRRRDLPGAGLFPLLSPGRCDAVVAQGHATAASWLTCTVATARGIPYLLRGDTRRETEYDRPPTSRWIRRRLLGPLLRHAGVCLAVGSSNREFYSSFGVPDDRIVMTPFSVDNTKFSWPDDVLHSKKASAFSRLDLDPSCPTLLFAGKLQDHKRPLDLLWAARRMVTPVNVIVIGDGALRSAVESEMAAIPTARLLGFVNQSELGLWYGLSDIVVVPSSTEPWGLVVNEAMAAGTVPVVSDRVGCAPDLVLPCGGAVYPVGDVKALARTLDEMLGDPAGIARASQAARSVVERFSIEATARGYEEAVHLLLTPSAAK